MNTQAKATIGVLLGIMLISLGAMVAEIALTRVFSLVLYYHFAFLVVGIAMLGLGVGGLLVWRQTRRDPLAPGAPERWGVFAGLATAALAALLALEIPVGGILIYPSLAALPFAMVGAATAAVLARFPASSGRVYAADLAGAAAGALLSIPVLGQVGGINALLVAGATMAWGGWSLGAKSRYAPLRSLAAALLLTGLAVANPVTMLLDVNPQAIDGSKTMAEQLRSDGRLLFTRWDAFARTDVVVPEPQDDIRFVFLDGAAGAAMYRFDGNYSAPSPLRSDLGYFPFLDGQAGDVLAIGPGGGKDVLLAILGGARTVTAVEVNPGAVEAVRRFSDFNGGIYDRPEVAAIVDEGRAYLKRSSREYDTIYISLAMTQAAERVGYALAENYLYTVEAFRDYLDRLKPGGQLVLKVHDQRDLARVVRTAKRALEERGTSLDQVSWHLLALSEATMLDQHGGEIMYPLLVVRRDPYTPSEAEKQLGSALSAGFVPIHMEAVGGLGPLSALSAFGVVVEDSDHTDEVPDPALSPTTDDRPFFYLYQSGPPPVVLLLMAAIVALGMVTWGRLRSTVPGGIRGLRPSLAYFVCIGVAFMLVEVTLIQKLTLFLGHPTFAVTTVLFSVLVFGAVGSWLGGRLDHITHVRSIGTAMAGMLALIYAQLLQQVTASFFGAPAEQRILIAAGLIAPLGIAMGVPLPSGLRRLATISRVPLASLAWAANGLASVFGSASAIAIATTFGFSASLAAGGVVYLAAALLGALAVAVEDRSASPAHAAQASSRVLTEPELA